MCLHGRHVSAVLGEDGRIEFRIHQAGGVSHLLSLSQCLLTPLLSLVRIAHRPQDLREPGEGHDATIMPTAEKGGGGTLGVAEAQTLLHMGPGCDELTPIERYRPLGHMAL